MPAHRRLPFVVLIGGWVLWGASCNGNGAGEAGASDDAGGGPGTADARVSSDAPGAGDAGGAPDAGAPDGDTFRPVVVERTLPPASERTGPVTAMKHQRFTEVDGGKVFMVSGDWGFPDGHGSSGRQDTIAYDLVTDTWTIEVPYCGEGRGHPLRTDEVAQAWDPSRGRLWMGPGVYYGGSECDGEGVPSPAYYVPATDSWHHQDQTGTRPWAGAPRAPTHWVYDDETDRLIVIHDRVTGYFPPETGAWRFVDHRFGGFSESPLAQVGRHVYVVDERVPGEQPYALWRWHIDDERLEEVGPLPEPLRDGNGDDHGRVHMSARDSWILLHQDLNSDLEIEGETYLLDTSSMTYRVVELPDGVRANGIVWHSSGWALLLGGTVGYDYLENPLQKFWLVDLRAFAGGGPDLSSIGSVIQEGPEE